MSRKTAIDLGTSTLQIYVDGKGVVLNEPSVIAVDKYLNKVTRVGREAAELIGREPEGIEVVRPIRDGVISRFSHTVVMLKRFYAKACGRTLLPPSVVITVPSIVTDVEEHAVRDAAVSAGMKDPFLLDEPVAAVICLGGSVLSSSVRTAGDEMTEAIIRYCRSKYSLLIGEQTAEQAKIAIGSVWRRDDIQTVSVKGKSLKSRAPVLTELTSNDMTEALFEPVTALIEEICAVIDKTPPELVSDIAESGIILTGGGCQIYGLDKLISSVTGLPVKVADDPALCVVKGAGMADKAGLIPIRERK